MGPPRHACSFAKPSTLPHLCPAWPPRLLPPCTPLLLYALPSPHPTHPRRCPPPPPPHTTPPHTHTNVTLRPQVALGILKRMGCTNIVTAEDGEAALEALHAAGGVDAFDVILMDLHMPKKVGACVCVLCVGKTGGGLCECVLWCARCVCVGCGGGGGGGGWRLACACGAHAHGGGWGGVGWRVRIVV
jgi:hypothetical protein